MSKRKKKVYIGMSGGVDSSVSAYILKEQGYDVVGVFIDVWQPEFLECTSGEDRLDAMRVCGVLDIPFKTFDAKEEYKNKVVDYMIDEYALGRTPNPDVMCNKHIKFGLFFDWAMRDGADLIATGHYARTKFLKTQIGESCHLLRGVDREKDQTYFLWSVSADVFSKVIFPIGEMKKSKVRKIAESAELPVARKKDSQGVCFLGKVDMMTFLSRYIRQKQGNVVDEAGSVIGFHQGAHFYTSGQRHGFTVIRKSSESKPFYVISKDIEKNTLRVSSEPYKYGVKNVFLDSFNRIPEDAFDNIRDEELTCLARYRQSEIRCRYASEGEKVFIEFSEPQYSLAVGQSLVIYKSEYCIGGGIIDRIE